jgi:hypothetical protein
MAPLLRVHVNTVSADLRDFARHGWSCLRRISVSVLFSGNIGGGFVFAGNIGVSLVFAGNIGVSLVFAGNIGVSLVFGGISVSV